MAAPPESELQDKRDEDEAPLDVSEIPGDKLAAFLSSGIYRLGNVEQSSVVFVDAVRLLNRGYSRFRVSPSRYYSRSFRVGNGGGGQEIASPPLDAELRDSKKRKRRQKKNKKRGTQELNEREKAAEQRHREARQFLLRAHEALLRETDLLSVIPEIVCVHDDASSLAQEDGPENNFIELGRIWQAPMYEMTSRCSDSGDKYADISEGSCSVRNHGKLITTVFNNFVTNIADQDLEAEFLGRHYILPRKCSFYTSDLKHVFNIIPAYCDDGFNLIVIDPPWENASAIQKNAYPTVPNYYFLNLPVNQLAHTEGAFLALWLTNREKLRLFVENELFPAWGVTNVLSCYWLKVKADGCLIGDLDLFHHRPYECFLLGYIRRKEVGSECRLPSNYPKNSQVFISVPGAYSRKPPLGLMLSEHLLGLQPPRCIELFARELLAGWTSWGNETLRFQDSRYFTDTKGCFDEE